MFNVLYLKCPDGERIYHVWHYCSMCGNTYDHSVYSWNKIKESICCRDPENLINVPIQNKYAPVVIAERKIALPLSLTEDSSLKNGTANASTISKTIYVLIPAPNSSPPGSTGLG